MRFWKQFEGWVTGLKSNLFVYTRIKLTIIYSFVIILGIIGYVVLLDQEIDRAALSTAQEITDPERKQRFIERTDRAVTTALYGVQPEDVLMMVIVILGSYFLASIALKPLKESLDNQKAFLEDTAHQLKTPLAIIKTEMEVFLRDKRNYAHNPELLIRRRSGVLSNLDEIDRMNQIINDLLLIARIDNHQEILQKMPIDLTDLTKKTISNLVSYAHSQKVDLKFHSKGSNLIEADPDKLQQALYNIIKNGIDCSSPNETINVRLKQNGQSVMLEVIDSGIGIDKRELSHIFKRYYRTKNSLTHKIKGTGLGLTLAKWVIQEHKGEIRVKSILGKGTTFTILLPRISPS